MRFIISSSSLSNQLMILNGVINTNSVIPILQYFLFDIKKGILTISASDLETSIKTTLHVEATENGKIAMPSRILLETLKTFPEQPLTFSVDTTSHVIEISSNNGKYKLKGENGEDFPAIPEPDSDNSLNFSSEVLSQAVNKVLFAVGNDDARPAMRGIYCQINKNDIIFVATDAHKLVKFQRTDIKSAQPASFIFPKKTLMIIKSLLAEKDDTLITMRYNDTTVFLTLGNVHLVCRLIDEKYPDYETVIPLENPNKLVLNRNAFLNSLRRVSIYSSKTTHLVKLKIAGSELQISSEDIDYANAANERLTCQFEGQDMEIGFNSKFLIEMLTAMESTDVSLEMSEPDRAGLLFPAVRSNNEEVLMLVMPVMVHNFVEA